jgi:hypothetical protein
MNSSPIPRGPLHAEPPRSAGRVPAVLTLAVASSIAFSLLIPWVLAQRDAARQAQVTNTFKQLRSGFQNYYDYQHSLPPIYKSGEAPPLARSWRVALCRHMCTPVDYDDAQAWNSPRNQRVATRREAPSFFRSPFSQTWSSDFSDFLAVPLDQVPALRQAGRRVEIFRFGGEEIAIAEIPDSTIHWMDPNGN